MAKSLAFTKLIAVCAFIWLQALQIDHFADQAVNADHVDCLICKNMSDSITPENADPSFSKLVFTSNLSTRVSLDVPPARLIRSDPARAPPAFT